MTARMLRAATLAALALGPGSARAAAATAPLAVVSEADPAWGVPLAAHAVAQSAFLVGEEGVGAADLARDGDLSTSWTWVASDGRGWVELALPPAARVSAITLHVGRFAPGRAFADLARPETVTVLADDRAVGVARLADSPAPQHVVLSKPVAASRLRLRVDSVRPGRQDPEISLAEVEVYGEGEARPGWDLRGTLLFHRDLGDPGAPAWHVGLLAPDGSARVIHRGAVARISPAGGAVLVWDRTGVTREGAAPLEQGDLWILDASGRRGRRVATGEAERISIAWSRDGSAFRLEQWSPRRSRHRRTYFDREGVQIETLEVRDAKDAEHVLAARHAERDAAFCPSPLLPAVAYPEGKAPSPAGCPAADASSLADHPELRWAAGEGGAFVLGDGPRALAVSLADGVLRVRRADEQVDRADGVERAYAFPGDPASLYVVRRGASGPRLYSRPFPGGGPERFLASLGPPGGRYQLGAGQGAVVVHEGAPCAADASTRVIRADGARVRSFAGGVEIEAVGWDESAGASPFLGEVRLLEDRVVLSAWTRDQAGIWLVDPASPGGVREIVPGGTFASPPAGCP